MQIFDTHAHLLSREFDADRPQVLREMQEKGVSLVMEACCTEKDIPGILAFTRENDFAYGALGLHPEELYHVVPDALEQVEKNLMQPGILAVGEIGLDYHWETNPPREMQKQYLDGQLSMAAAYKKPVILHVRDAHGDCMDILRAHRQGLEGVMHCFSGSYETARECLDLGLYIGVGRGTDLQKCSEVERSGAKSTAEPPGSGNGLPLYGAGTFTGYPKLSRKPDICPGRSGQAPEHGGGGSELHPF